MPTQSGEQVQIEQSHLTRLTIGQVARQVGLSAKAIRYYEDSGVLPPPTRTANGYRAYTRADLNRLLLLGRLRALGVPLSLMRDLLASAPRAACGEVQREVRAVLTDHLAALDREIADLTRLRTLLGAATRAIATCPSDDEAPFALCHDLSCVAPAMTDRTQMGTAEHDVRPPREGELDGKVQEECHHGDHEVSCCATSCA